jgi:hypothetical protein
MAKPTVTETDLAAGLSSLGGFGGLTGAGTARRDSPFGSSFAKAPAVQQPPAQAVAQAPSPVEKPQTVIELKIPAEPVTPPVQSQTESPVASVALAPAPPVVKATPPEPEASKATQAVTVAPAPERTPTVTVSAQPVARSEEPSSPSSPIAKRRVPPPAPARATQTSGAEEKAPTAHSAPKSDLYTERVTTIMSPEMRDRLNQLAANLQRRKNDPTERITANTLTRVAINIFLEELLPLDTETPRTEEELYALTKAKVKRRA